jgi:dCTP deaminase
MRSKHLWFLYQQGIELTARFDLYLDEVAGLCSHAESELVQYFREQLDPIRRDLAAGITELAQIDLEAELGGSREKGHISAYQNAVVRMQNLHFDFRFFPVQPSIPPEVYILLADFFPTPAFAKIQPVVTYFPDHNFEQLNMFSLTAGGEAQVVLRMPYVEFRNPLMWTNLIHEMGHALDAPDATHSFSDEFFVKHKAILGDREKTIAWASEFYADQVAIKLAGPAYLCAFIAWHLARDPRTLGAEPMTHPPPRERVFAMKQHLQRQSQLQKWSFLLDVSRTFLELPIDLAVPQGRMVEEAFSNVAANDQLIPCDNHVLAARGMLAGLDAYTPVSSRRKASSKQIRELVERLRSSEFQSVEDFYAAIRVIQEEASCSCAIINAGWEWKLGKGLDDFIKIFSANDEEFKNTYKASKSGFAERYETYKTLLLSFETRLRKSIEVARLHKLWELAEEEKTREEAGASIQVSEASEPEQNAREETDASTSVPNRQKTIDGEIRPNVETARPSLLNEKEIIDRLLRDDDRRLVVTPILSLRQQIQPTSIDLRLGTEFALIRSALFESLNVLESEKAKAMVARYMEKVHVQPDEEFVLHPGEFALGSTLEYFMLPSDLAGRLDGKSTWGRVGLQIHSTAGFVDPGFEGALTFELQNVGRVPIPLFPGMRVAQICFFKCGESSIPYSKKGDGLYGGSPGLLSTQFFRLPDQKILKIIQDRLKKKR